MIWEDPTHQGPVGQLPPDDWLRDAATRAVVEALSRAGGEPRFVGGCVRDSLARRAVRDIDLATPLPPRAIISALEDAGLKALPTGIKHGTITAVSSGKTFEITTLRRDVATDGRHAEVAFTDDWTEDAKRRDFTINALSASPEGAVFDPFDGLGDLAHGRVRFVGPPEHRIREDYLRILRFFRFYATHGRPPADKAALEACRLQASHITDLSAERVWAEFRKILLSPQPAEVLGLMQGVGVLQQIVFGPVRIGRLRLLAWLETDGLKIETAKPDPIRRLAALIDGPEAEGLATRLKLSNADRTRLIEITRARLATLGEIGPELYEKGREVVADHLLIQLAEAREDGGVAAQRIDALVTALEETASWKKPIFPLTGHDVAGLGIPPGPLTGRLLRQVESWWVGAGFQPDRQACLERLAQAATDDQEH
ncbi:MAG: CCA tRNA nucleotidyltransferase [Magnetovibrionaceae bacterium]